MIRSFTVFKHNIFRNCFMNSLNIETPLQYNCSGISTSSPLFDHKTQENKQVKSVTQKSKTRDISAITNIPQLMEFFDEMENWGEREVRCGRAWKVDELRIKSNQDLHKLWFVLYKEKNMLLTMQEACDNQNQYFPSPERIDKVEDSMKNIETVVKERNRAYLQLEVSEEETGMRPYAFRRDNFGRYRWISCSEHLIPYHMNKKWLQLWGPGKGKEVTDFYHELKEVNVEKLFKRRKDRCFHVRQLLRRFPNLDVNYLQELYPDVPVKYFKENMHLYYDTRDLIDETVYEKEDRF